MLNLRQLSNGILLTGAVSVLVTQSAWADVVEITDIDINPTNNGIEIIYKTVNGAVLKDEQIIKPKKINIPPNTNILGEKIALPIIYSAKITNAKLKKGRISKILPQPNNNNIDYIVIKNELIGENNNITMDFRYLSNKTPSNNTIQLKPPEIKITQHTDKKFDEKPGTSAQAEPILGNWLAEDRSIQPLGFIFQKNNKLIVVYQSSSGAFTIEGKYNIGQKTGSYTDINLIINDRTIKTIFQIVDGNVLSMELMELKKGKKRPTEITQKRERKFKMVDNLEQLISK